MASFADSSDSIDSAASGVSAGTLNQSDDLLKIVSVSHSLQFEASTPAIEVVRALGQQADYAVVVCQQQFVGLITLKEIVKALGAGIDLAQCSVGSLSLRLATLDVSELSDLLAVSQRFQQQETHYLPVLQQQQVVGVLRLEQVATKLRDLLAHPAAFWMQPAAQPAQLAPPLNLSHSLFQLANASHEMRASISGILAFAELLSSDLAVRQHYAEALGCIQHTCHYLMTLSDDICLFAQLEANRTLPQQETCNLHELLKDLKQRFQMQARAKHLEFFLEQDGALPQYIITDSMKLRRILDNLLSNAIKFTQRGKVTLKLIVRDQIYFEIQDTGMGIAPDEQDSIFEPFVQAAAGRQSAQGVGLGLTISQRLAQMLGGEIWVSSVLGQGTTVQLAMPMQKR